MQHNKWLVMPLEESLVRLSWPSGLAVTSAGAVAALELELEEDARRLDMGKEASKFFRSAASRFVSTIAERRD